MNQLTEHDIGIQGWVGAKEFLVFHFGDIIGWARGGNSRGSIAEKDLKALLQELGVPIPRTHNLEDLLDPLLPHDATLKSLRRRLNTLTDFVVDFRYPGISGTTRQAKAELRAAEQVRNELRRRLGLPT